ncbi:MAG: DnaJ domain-containing protein [Acidobacteria bacterium]|nr:DnaJ domain-containing protein [Acidobacteriota bacterium]
MTNLTVSENPYETLGLASSATEVEIKQAYFALVREHSPERDPEGFKRIRAAYEKLRAASDRAATDLFMIDESLPVITALPAVTVNPLAPESLKADLLELEALRLLEDALASVS